jgi:tricorn protease-like protein
MRLSTTALGLTLLVLLASPALAAKGYLRSPDLHSDRVIFVAERDIWVCSDEEAGVEELLRLHGENPPVKPDFGKVPPKNRNSFKKEK